MSWVTLAFPNRSSRAGGGGRVDHYSHTSHPTFAAAHRVTCGCDLLRSNFRGVKKCEMAQVKQIIVHQLVSAVHQMIAHGKRRVLRTTEIDGLVVGNESLVCQAGIPGPYPQPLPPLNEWIFADVERCVSATFRRNEHASTIGIE